MTSFVMEYWKLATVDQGRRVKVRDPEGQNKEAEPLTYLFRRPFLLGRQITVHPFQRHGRGSAKR